MFNCLRNYFQTDTQSVGNPLCLHDSMVSIPQQHDFPVDTRPVFTRKEDSRLGSDWVIMHCSVLIVSQKSSIRTCLTEP